LAELQAFSPLIGEDIFGVTIDNGAPYRLSGRGGAIQGIIAAIAQMIGLRQPDTVTAMVTVRIVGTQTPVDPVDPGPANPRPTDPDPTDPGPTDPVNTAPVAAAPTVGAPDPATGVVTGRINATDPDGDALTFTPAQPVTPKGAVSVTNSGTFTYLPSDTARQQAASATATDTDRTDTFVVSVADGRGGVIAVSVDVAVLPA
ncbi:MAG TPA: Ig-like domain-containing protein, partial [Mycobacterium sp.]|nr:Ig-like domain-containing protein [Mycobacterium sp.]